MAILIGMDGGGTRTRVVARRIGGSVQGPFVCGGSSLSRRSRAQVEAELRAGVAAALRADERGDVAAVCGGFASAGAHKVEYEDILRGIFPGARVLVLTDAELAWRGAFGGSDGIVVISGTGSIAWGRRNGAQARAGGLGPGRDLGSGDWLAIHPGPEHYRQAGRDLANLVRIVAEQLDWHDPRVCAVGGVIESVPEVRSALAASIPWRLEAPLASATTAALDLAQSLLTPDHAAPA